MPNSSHKPLRSIHTTTEEKATFFIYSRLPMDTPFPPWHKTSQTKSLKQARWPLKKRTETSQAKLRKWSMSQCQVALVYHSQPTAVETVRRWKRRANSLLSRSGLFCVCQCGTARSYKGEVSPTLQPSRPPAATPHSNQVYLTLTEATEFSKGFCL